MGIIRLIFVVILLQIGLQMKGVIRITKNDDGRKVAVVDNRDVFGIFGKGCIYEQLKR